MKYNLPEPNLRTHIHSIYKHISLYHICLNIYFYTGTDFMHTLSHHGQCTTSEGRNGIRCYIVDCWASRSLSLPWGRHTAWQADIHKMMGCPARGTHHICIYWKNQAPHSKNCPIEKDLKFEGILSNKGIQESRIFIRIISAWYFRFFPKRVKKHIFWDSLFPSEKKTLL